MNLSTIRKALMAGGGAALAALVASIQDHGTPTQSDYVTAVLTGAAVGWATWKVRNAPGGEHV